MRVAVDSPPQEVREGCRRRTVIRQLIGALREPVYLHSERVALEAPVGLPTCKTY